MNTNPFPAGNRRRRNKNEQRVSRGAGETLGRDAVEGHRKMANSEGTNFFLYLHFFFFYFWYVVARPSIVILEKPTNGIIRDSRSVTGRGACKGGRRFAEVVAEMATSREAFQQP